MAKNHGHIVFISDSVQCDVVCSNTFVSETNGHYGQRGRKYRKECTWKISYIVVS
jgi:hypothetical protein